MWFCVVFGPVLVPHSWKKNITELKTQGTCTCIASYHHIFKTLFARKTPKIASVMID